MKDQRHNEVYIDQYDFIRVVYHGDLDENGAMHVYEDMLELVAQLKREKKDIVVLADIRDMGKHAPNVPRIGLKIRETIPFRKMALVVSDDDPETVTISQMVTAKSKRKKEIGYFASEKNAIKWLKSEET